MTETNLIAPAATPKWQYPNNMNPESHPDVIAYRENYARLQRRLADLEQRTENALAGAAYEKARVQAIIDDRDPATIENKVELTRACDELRKSMERMATQDLPTVMQKVTREIRQAILPERQKVVDQLAAAYRQLLQAVKAESAFINAAERAGIFTLFAWTPWTPTQLSLPSVDAHDRIERLNEWLETYSRTKFIER